MWAEEGEKARILDRLLPNEGLPSSLLPLGVARANRVVVGVRVCWASTELL